MHKMNKMRRVRVTEAKETESLLNRDYSSFDENSFMPGDVYVTCHSNLSTVQVVSYQKYKF
jgi:hypothetical protein